MCNFSKPLLNDRFVMLDGGDDDNVVNECLCIWFEARSGRDGVHRRPTVSRVPYSVTVIKV